MLTDQMRKNKQSLKLNFYLKRSVTEAGICENLLLVLFVFYCGLNHIYEK